MTRCHGRGNLICRPVNCFGAAAAEADLRAVATGRPAVLGVCVAATEARGERGVPAAFGSAAPEPNPVGARCATASIPAPTSAELSRTTAILVIPEGRPRDDAGFGVPAAVTPL